MKLDSSMREVLLFIKYSKDDESLENILQSDDRFKNLERHAADVIEVITKSGLKYEPSEEVVNMCEAIQQMRKKSEHIGEINAKKSAAENFYSMGMDIEKIAQGLREPIETIKE